MKFKTLAITGFAIFLSFAFTGCGTITRGTTQALVVESDPPGADVELSNGLRGRTPASFNVKRKENLVVKIKKNGYEPVEANVTSEVGDGGGTAMAGNIIFGGLIGAAIDGGNGSNKTLRPNPVSVKLLPIATKDTLQEQPSQSEQPRKAEQSSNTKKTHKTKQ
ncbi:PEGA domain-containing protein [Chlorobaculum sp. MV4-Y]|jgi:hypothetical protein|uniref:PEGA domain-containing protein n=1 Tax=Chlorobaculum sp. MV4-Y TaxID=2976335 RepID=UPI0021AF3A13|nr:PEGA domain-containing protein [Chlorobaculum sp. MV4-Y]UWX58348.1 PEGA domain-containing protein [Chlorobaculum sp. MV4-Y]